MNLKEPKSPGASSIKRDRLPSSVPKSDLSKFKRTTGQGFLASQTPNDSNDTKNISPMGLNTGRETDRKNLNIMNIKLDNIIGGQSDVYDINTPQATIQQPVLGEPHSRMFTIDRSQEGLGSKRELVGES